MWHWGRLPVQYRVFWDSSEVVDTVPNPYDPLTPNPGEATALLSRKLHPNYCVVMHAVGQWSDITTATILRLTTYQRTTFCSGPQNY